MPRANQHWWIWLSLCLLHFWLPLFESKHGASQLVAGHWRASNVWSWRPLTMIGVLKCERKIFVWLLSKCCLLSKLFLWALCQMDSWNKSEGSKKLFCTNLQIPTSSFFTFSLVSSQEIVLINQSNLSGTFSKLQSLFILTKIYYSSTLCVVDLLWWCHNARTSFKSWHRALAHFLTPSSSGSHGRSSGCIHTVQARPLVVLAPLSLSRYKYCQRKKKATAHQGARKCFT